MRSKLWKSTDPILLASTSATRLKILCSAGIPVETCGPKVDERRIEAETVSRRASPDQVALALAKAKGLDVSSRYPDRWVVAADQTLALDGGQFHKPASVADARNQLRMLAGRKHDLYSAVACFHQEQLQFHFVESARLHMRAFSEAFLDDYLCAAGDAVTTSVGAYQFEGLGSHLFARVEGEYTTILGLPLLPLLSFFRDVGMLEA